MLKYLIFSIELCRGRHGYHRCNKRRKSVPIRLEEVWNKDVIFGMLSCDGSGQNFVITTCEFIGLNMDLRGSVEWGRVMGVNAFNI